MANSFGSVFVDEEEEDEDSNASNYANKRSTWEIDVPSVVDEVVGFDSQSESLFLSAWRLVLFLSEKPNNFWERLGSKLHEKNGGNDAKFFHDKLVAL